MNKRIVSVLLLICLGTAAVAGCGKSSVDRPTTLLPRLERACNDRDLSEFLDCIEPDATDLLLESAQMFGFREDTLEYLLPRLLSGMMEFSGMPDISDDSWGAVTLTPLDETVDGDYGTVSFNINVSFPDTEEVLNFDTSVDVVEVDGIWYIAGDSMLDITDLVDSAIHALF